LQARHPSQELDYSLDELRTDVMIKAKVINYRRRLRKEISPRAWALAATWGQRENIEAVTERQPVMEAEPEVQLVSALQPADDGLLFDRIPPHAMMVLKLAVQVVMYAPELAIPPEEVWKSMAKWTPASRNQMLYKVC
jgi:hypothetical protein